MQELRSQAASVEIPDDPSDDDIAKCQACGFEFGRYGDIKAEAMNAAKADITGRFKDAFKGLKGWKIK